jgi:hypothetical protein
VRASHSAGVEAFRAATVLPGMGTAANAEPGRAGRGTRERHDGGAKLCVATVVARATWDELALGLAARPRARGRKGRNTNYIIDTVVDVAS